MAVEEYEQGYYHGRQDAAQRLCPMYAEATCDYTQGYLKGYWNIFNSSQKTQQQQVSEQLQWKILLDPCDHQLYQVWISDHCLGEKASTIEEAERIAQKYVTTDKLIKRQNAAVMAAYAK